MRIQHELRSAQLTGSHGELGDQGSAVAATPRVRLHPQVLQFRTRPDGPGIDHPDAAAPDIGRFPREVFVFHDKKHPAGRRELRRVRPGAVVLARRAIELFGTHREILLEQDARGRVIGGALAPDRHPRSVSRREAEPQRRRTRLAVMVTRVAVVGASGRLGSVACRVIEEQSDLRLAARLNSRSDLDEMLGADVVLDVTTPGVSSTVVDHAVRAGLDVVVGTSGWSEERLRSLRTLLAGHPDRGVIVVPNFSVGSVLATHFAQTAARFYESIEIIEAHHAAKVDSPSGTAVRTAELIGRARADIGPVVAPHVDQRARGQQVAGVPVHSLRLQGVVAQQEVMLGGDGEVLTIRHQTLSPSSYEQGILLALRAAAEHTGLTVGLDSLIGLGPGAE